MEKLNLQNNNLNPRLYIYSKYAFSIGYFLLMLALFLMYLSSYKSLIPVDNLIITDIVILVLSISLFIFFIFFRINLHKKSKYKLNSKDKKWYIVTSLLTVLSMIIIVVWLSILKTINSSDFLVWWIISLVVLVIFSFTSSVIEYLARFNEFSFIATIYEQKAQENDAIVVAQQFAEKGQTAESIFNNESNIKQEDEVNND